MVSSLGQCEPIYFKPDMGKSFCKGDFFNYVEKTFVKAIKKYNLIKRGDHVAVAVSGGKDSMVLLYLMDKIERQHFDVELTVVHLDEGIKGYSDRARVLVREFTKDLGIRLLEASYAELFKYSIDFIASLHKEVRVFEPCTYCGVWRRWGLNYLADKAGADKLATAHTMDDEAQTVVMNVIRGGFDNLVKQDLFPEGRKGFIPRIKPFRLLLERETALYAILKGIPYIDVTCPYAHLGMRWDIRFWLYEQEEKHPGTLRNILAFEEKLLECCKDRYSSVELKKCKICGYPSSSELCRAHELQEFINKKLGET